MMMNTLVELFWKAMTNVGTRRVCGILQKTLPAYRDTVFYFENLHDCVAITIDDGLCRGEESLLPEVLDLLRSHEAHATFFVCTDYTPSEAAARVVQEGHELGNHLGFDPPHGHFTKLSREDFEREVRSANDFLTSVDGKAGDERWFRAPQCLMTRQMLSVVKEQGMRNALGDVYCDDWLFADSDSSHVAPLMLRQTQGGSIAMFHMPERGFREGCLSALEAFLDGLKERKLRCLTLSEMEILTNK